MKDQREAAAAEPAPAMAYAGLWRRLAAFAIDVMLLGALGVLLGWLAFDALAALGPWGRLVGFALALPYFGLMNSRLGGGRTLGKRLLGLRTLGLDGQALSPARGLLRALVVTLPWFLNNAVSDPELLRRLPLVLLLSLLVFGGGLSLAYLLLFNRPSRRSLHDALAGSVVLQAQGSARPDPVAAAVWSRPHRGVVVVLLLSSLALPAWFASRSDEGEWATLSALQASAVRVPGVRQAGVSQGWTAAMGQPSTRSTHLALLVWSTTPVTDDALADRVVARLLQSHADALAAVDQVVVTVVHGYDIGIASSWQSRRVALPPAAWRERLQGGVAPQAMAGRPQGFW